MGLYCIIPFLHTPVALSETGQKVKSCLHLIQLWFTKSSNLPKIISSVSWSIGKSQETYWSMPKSPDQAITFLHCCLSGNAVSSHSSIFLHLRCHFRNLWYSPSLTVQSILGPSIYGMNVPDANCGCLHGLSVTSGSCSWSELDSLSWLLSISSSWVDTVPSTQVELFIAIGSLDLYQNWVGLSEQLYYWLLYAGCTFLPCLLVGCVFDLYFDLHRVPWDSELLLSGLFQGNINVVLTEKLFASLILI